MCMWPFTNPGVTSRWRASITRSARAPASVAALPTRLTRPPSMRIEPSRMILRSRSTVRTYRALSILRLWAVMGEGLAPRSPPLELRATLLREGLHAFLIVLAVEAIGDQLVQHHEIALDVGTHELLDGGLGRAQGERSVAGHRQRVVAGEVFKLRLRHDLVHEPHAERILGGEVGTGGEEDLLRVGRPDELHQLFHALIVVTQTQPRRGDAEAGVVGGVALLRLVEDDPADRPVLLQQKLRRFAHGALLSRNDIRATCIASARVTQAPPRGGGQWVAADAGRGRSTTRHALAAPVRLGSIWARRVRFRLAGTGLIDPARHPPRPTARRCGGARLRRSTR